MTTVRARGLGAEVRKLRKAAGLRLEELADRCGWSRATLGRIEAGTKTPAKTEIAVVLGTLRVTGKERDRVLDLADEADQTHWWEFGNPKVPAQLAALIDFESRATKITNVSMTLMPGLLQTPVYTRSVIATGGWRNRDLECRVAVRHGRQSVLTQENPVVYHAVIDESVLKRPIGGSAAMAEQLRHVQRMARQSNVMVQVLPFQVGAHVGLNGSQMMLEFKRQRNIVHLEHRRASLFLDDPAETSAFFESAASLADAALGPDDSMRFIGAHVEAFDAGDQGVA